MPVTYAEIRLRSASY